MNCPTCNTELKIADRSGIEIDYCPKCRGIWLDKGELDKIIERSGKYYDDDSDVRYKKESYPDARYDKGYDSRGYDDKDRYKYGHHKKRKNFLEDLFDF